MADETLSDSELPFTSHLEELRKRLMYAAGAWLVGFIACYGFAEKLFGYISAPAKNALPPGKSLVFITATEPFFTYLKMAALAGFLVTLPIILWQVWAFIAPGLYSHEKRFAIPFVTCSFLCFLGGPTSASSGFSRPSSSSSSSSAAPAARSRPCSPWAPT